MYSINVDLKSYKRKLSYLQIWIIMVVTVWNGKKTKFRHLGRNSVSGFIASCVTLEM